MLGDFDKQIISAKLFQTLIKLRKTGKNLYNNMINIAIDGPSGSGKSTVAKILSQKLNILYLDTGAMYRACGLKAKRLGVSPSDEKAVSSFIGDINIKIVYEGGAQHTYLDGADVSSDIRINEISKYASDISALKIVREKMVEMQRKVAAEQPCVLDGRDICAYVLPNAKYKFFMTAKPEIRAERRVKELIRRGQTADFSTILSEINARDYNDSHRAVSPLKQADDAELIDTSFMTADEVAAYIINIVKNGENIK